MIYHRPLYGMLYIFESFKTNCHIGIHGNTVLTKKPRTHLMDLDPLVLFHILIVSLLS